MNYDQMAWCKTAAVGFLLGHAVSPAMAQVGTLAPTQAVSSSPLTDHETVLTLKEGSVFVSHYLRPGRRDRITSWLPTADDLRQLQAACTAITPKVGLPDPQQGLPRTDVTPYYRQYVPVVENGRRLIVISGLSPAIMGSSPGDGGPLAALARLNEWRTSGDFVFDGGRNVFRAVYDAGGHKIVLFGFNGK